MLARLSINEMTTFRWPFEQDVASYAAADIGAIGVWRQKLSDFGEEEGIDLLRSSGLRVSNLLWAGGFTGSDGRTYRDSLEDAVEAIRLAAVMQAGCLVVYSGGRNGHTHNHCRRLVRAALTELLSVAQDLDVVLALEPMHAGCAGDWTFLTDLGETIDLLDSLASPQVKLVFDTYHLGQDRDVFDLIPAIVDRIAVVHLGDGKRAPEGDQNRCRLGDGSLPVGELVDALISAGYTGDFDVELLGEDLETAAYDDLICHSKEAYHTMLGVREGSLR